VQGTSKEIVEYVPGKIFCYLLITAVVETIFKNILVKKKWKLHVPVVKIAI